MTAKELRLHNSILNPTPEFSTLTIEDSDITALVAFLDSLNEDYE
jgi:hypothetical protein